MKQLWGNEIGTIYLFTTALYSLPDREVKAIAVVKTREKYHPLILAIDKTDQECQNF